MNIQVDASRLLELENAYNKLICLENGGVDNWEWYSESLKDFEKIDTLDDYGIESRLEFSKNQTVFYNNNEAKFVSYLSEKIAVVIIEAFPDFENTDVSLCCSGCQIGDSDNKLSCNCEELEWMLENIKESTDPTYIPLIVNVSMLYKKPIVISNHEKELELLENKKKETFEKTKALTLKNIELQAKENELLAKIKALSELVELQ